MSAPDQRPIEAPFPVGTIYMSGGKVPHRCTVCDIHTTRNLAGHIVRVSYVSTHEYHGQTFRDPEVSPLAIARGFISRPNNEVSNPGHQH